MTALAIVGFVVMVVLALAALVGDIVYDLYRHRLSRRR
jgi:hypothetical protein